MIGKVSRFGKEAVEIPTRTKQGGVIRSLGYRKESVRSETRQPPDPVPRRYALLVRFAMMIPSGFRAYDWNVELQACQWARRGEVEY